MEILVDAAGPIEGRTQLRRWRALSIFAAVALVLGGIALAQHASDPSPAKSVNSVQDVTDQIGGVGGAVGQTLGFGAGVQAQFDAGALIRNIMCPILNALASGPFAAFLGGIINSLRAAFGCTSG